MTPMNSQNQKISINNSEKSTTNSRFPTASDRKRHYMQNRIRSNVTDECFPPDVILTFIKRLIKKHDWRRTK